MYEVVRDAAVEEARQSALAARAKDHQVHLAGKTNELSARIDKAILRPSGVLGFGLVLTIGDRVDPTLGRLHGRDHGHDLRDRAVLVGEALCYIDRPLALRGAVEAHADSLDPAWRSELPARLDALAAAWRDAAAWEGVTTVGGASLPAAAMGGIALNEVLVHGWDLAVATGQDYRPDPAAVEACLQLVIGLNQPGNEELRNGQFGPVVPVPAAAPALDRRLGLAGRSPGWPAR